MECYICYDKETSDNKFCTYSPCKCTGTNKIHVKCFRELKEKCGNTCSICKSKFFSSTVVEKIPEKRPVKVEKTQTFQNYGSAAEYKYIPDESEKELWRSEYRALSQSNSKEEEYRRVDMIRREIYKNDMERYYYILKIEEIQNRKKQEEEALANIARTNVPVVEEPDCNCCVIS